MTSAIVQLQTHLLRVGNAPSSSETMACRTKTDRLQESKQRDELFARLASEALQQGGRQLSRVHGGRE